MLIYRNALNKQKQQKISKKIADPGRWKTTCKKILVGILVGG